MENICSRTENLLGTLEDYLRPSKKLEEAWMEQTQTIYNFLKEEECHYGLPTPARTLPRLHINGLDAEQVWQLVELQNKTLLAAPEDLKELDNSNLYFTVARLSSLAKHDKLSNANGLLSEDDDDISDSAHESEDLDSDEREDQDEIKDLENMNDESEKMSDGDDDDDEDDELFKKPVDFEDSNLNDVFGDDSDDEEDNFDEFIAKEGIESDDSEQDDDKTFMKNKPNIQKSEVKQEKTSNRQKFAKTEVDTKFFNLRESEWVADNDLIGEDKFDLMADVSDDDEEGEGIMYDGFFDAPEASSSSGKKLSEMLEEEEEEDDDMDEELDSGEDEKDDKDSDQHENDDEQTHPTEDNHTPLLEDSEKQIKSTFEKAREKELKLMEELEEENLNEKPWYLKGEVVNAERPQNSALEEHLEYDIAVRQKPTITEDTTAKVEKIIMGRIRIKAWDDVERKVKPTVDPFEFKKKLVLEQDKSKKSLAEIYEEEYLKKQKEEGDAEEEPEEHKEIKERMDKLFTKLDALTNYHYTPTQPMTDIKIVSNLPAITVEETTPATASDATLLAPQEILESKRGELVGETERTNTDRKRDRRIKKKHQKNKAKIQDRKLQEKIRRASGKDGSRKLDRSTTMKVIEKAVKSGQVKVLDGNQDKTVKSSQTFFKQLQDSKKQKNKSKKKKRDTFSASKVLL